jgi:hypothetical protein
MKIIIILSGFLISVLNFIGQNEINFKPKQLFKEVKNQFKCENPIFVEFENNSEIITNSLNEKYFKIKNNLLLIGYTYIGRVKTCRTAFCSASNNFKKDTQEFFDYFILFDTLAKIIAVNIYNYQASHGQEITIKSWLNQFIGYDGSSELIVGKNIDAISGATISVHSITNDILNKTRMLKKYISQQKNRKNK